MVDNKKPHNEPGDPGAKAAQSGGVAARPTVGAPHQSGAAGGPEEEGGPAVSEAVERTGSAGRRASRGNGDVAAETVRRGIQLTAEARRHYVEDATDLFEEAGETLARAARQAAEDARVLMPSPRAAADGLQETQWALAGVLTGMTCANLRLTREVLRLSNPSVFIDLQQVFARECFGALAEGQAIMLRAMSRTAGEALRPIELQLEQRRHGRRGAGQGSLQASRVADVMSRGARVANPEDTVQQAARLMRQEDIGVLPVGENDRLVGMVTDRDVALRLAAEGKDPARTKVREVMTPDVRYVFDDEDVHRAVETMADQQVRRLPVLDRKKRLVGIVSLGDLATGSPSPRLAGRALAGVAREGGQHNQAAE